MIGAPGPSRHPRRTGEAERASRPHLAHDARVDREAVLPPNFGWLTPGRVAGMACPRLEELPALLREGIGAVLSLTTRPIPADGVAPGLVVRHEPVPDFAPPSPAQLRAIVAWIRAQLEAGRPVAVHCMAGMGRTGTVLAAWRVSEGAPAAAAIAEVRRQRPGSIETTEQEDAVHAFARDWAAEGEVPDA